MRALTWQGKRNVVVETVPDPRIEEPNDAVIRVTSTAICGSDLHLYEVLAPFLTPGDILGHETMGVVEEVGPAAGALKVGDRVVVPFNISCGSCWMCSRGLFAQCETTQTRETGKGARLFGYTSLYGAVPGGQAEYMRVPHADFGPVKVPDGAPDERWLYLSDILPTAWQAFEYAAVPPGGTVAVFGLGPIGEMAARIALHRGASQVFGIDLVPERLERARSRGVTAIDLSDHDKDLTGVVLDLTDGRGPDGVIDAVGMEAHGSPVGKLAHQATALLPDAIAAKFMTTAGTDRLGALYGAIDMVRRGGTISLSGVYGGMADPMPMLKMFDKQIQLRMGQANVHRWVPDILPLLTDEDPLGTTDFATHRLPLADAPEAYRTFQRKEDGMVKVLLQPAA